MSLLSKERSLHHLCKVPSPVVDSFGKETPRRVASPISPSQQSPGLALQGVGAGCRAAGRAGHGWTWRGLVTGLKMLQVGLE